MKTDKQYRAPRAFNDAESGVYVAGILTAKEIDRLGKSRLAALVEEGRVREEDLPAMTSEADLRRAGTVPESDIKAAVKAGAEPDKAGRKSRSSTSE